MENEKKPIKIPFKSITRTGKKLSRRLMRVVNLLVLLLIVVAVFFAFYVSNDKRVTRDVVRGLEQGWISGNDESALQSRVGRTETGFILEEYEAVKEYKDAEFRDEQLGAMIKDYIEALEGCRAAIEKYDPNEQYDEFWAEFSPYYGLRLKTLYQLTTRKDGFEISGREYPEQRKNIMVNGWVLDKIAGLDFVKGRKDGVTVYSASTTNISGYDIASVEIGVELLNDKNKVVEETTAFVSDWKKREEKEISFSQIKSGVTSYRIIYEVCIIE